MFGGRKAASVAITSGQMVSAFLASSSLPDRDRLVASIAFDPFELAIEVDVGMSRDEVCPLASGKVAGF